MSAAAATATARRSTAATATARSPTAAAPGRPKARISVVAMRLGRSAVANAAESATVPAGRARSDLPVADSLRSGWAVGASRLRLSPRYARLQILAHVSSIAVSQGGI